MKQPGLLYHSARASRRGSYKKTVIFIEPVNQKINAYLDYINCYNNDKTISSPTCPKPAKPVDKP